MTTHRLFAGIFFGIVLLFIAIFLITATPSRGEEKPRALSSLVPSPTPTVTPIPGEKMLENDYWVSQIFNNCGPASLSMLLSYFGISETQEKLGQDLRPYQTDGNNDDKSVTLDEMAKKVQEYDLLAYHRPNGDITLLKQFLANDIPVITRTWLAVNDDIGHYRVVKGYNDATGMIIQDDSYQGPNLGFYYDEFNTMWEKFDYEYLVLVPKNKKMLAEQIIGKNVDEKTAWQEAVKRNQAILAQNPSDVTSQFNLSIAYYHLGEYKKSIEAFEAVQYQLSPRTLWYQIEPIKAYYKIGNYEKVFAITNEILNNHNRAFSELYLLRGYSYRDQGNKQAAKSEFENAVFYNQNLQEAKDALKSV